MNRFVKSAILLGLVFGMSHAIGLQHGVFRSQSTQGKQWMGTATIVSEQYRMTVFPDYLDVELEWVFKAGGTAPDSFANALEIVGNLNLENNSTVVSMLVWYNGKILKAKLKPSGTARSQYEQVVERDAKAPPPPRDPVLFEYGWGKDNYDISIFPVPFNGTRKMRIRYLIPGATAGGVMKIGYPHAFTDSATVEIRKGPGVEAYTIETGNIPQLFVNADFAPLPESKYTFKAYGGLTDGERITSIIPVLPDKRSGTHLYVANFATDSFSGTMAQVSVGDGSVALLKSSIPEDFVVLWRWNNPEILRNCAREIVAQAGMLKTFFSAFNRVSKRGALVISIEGGTTRTFGLDRNGGAGFTAMTTYLDSLASLPVAGIGTVTSGKMTAEASKLLAKQALEEFKRALEIALDMFDDGSIPRHVLVLTAGVSMTASVDNTGTPQVLDSGIDLSLFTSRYAAWGNGTSSSPQVWSGVTLPQAVPVADTAFKIYAYITNGVQTDSFPTNSAIRSYAATVNDRFIYSDKPLAANITWKMFNRGELVSSYTEEPVLIRIEDGMQFARCIGSLKSMMPLASTMPTSLASTLGFIDMKYTLLALEEDVLDAEVAMSYEVNGVPVLDRSDIFPDTGEKAAIPTAAWLVANPRELPVVPMMWAVMRDGDKRVFEMAPVAAGGGAVRWANPAADVISQPASSEQTMEGSAVTGVQLTAPVRERGISFSVRQGNLIVERGFAGDLLSGMTVVLFDLNGRVVMRWKIDRALNTGAIVSMKLPKVKAGMYLVQISCGATRLSRSMLLQ